MIEEQRILLGGSASPIGWWVTFVERPSRDVTRWLERRWFDGRTATVADAGPYPGCVLTLEPLEAPWTKHLVIDAERWTVHVCNSLLGGDPSAPGPALARELGCRVVIAGHGPRHGPGHEGTALWVLGPDGTPPLSYVRTVQVDCADGRWAWYESGDPLPFEERHRYTARRKRDRFDRELLLRYLAALAIHPDDPDWFGAARRLDGAPTSGRSLSLVDARVDLGLSRS